MLITNASTNQALLPCFIEIRYLTGVICRDGYYFRQLETVDKKTLELSLARLYREIEKVASHFDLNLEISFFESHPVQYETDAVFYAQLKNLLLQVGKIDCVASVASHIDTVKDTVVMVLKAFLDITCLFNIKPQSLLNLQNNLQNSTRLRRNSVAAL